MRPSSTRFVVLALLVATRWRKTAAGRASQLGLVVALVGCETPPPLEPTCSDGWVDVRTEVPIEPDDLDLLLVVDPSRSMDDDRARVLAELTRTLRVYASGDTDDDGLRDFEPTRSVHVAVVSSDLGAGALHSGVAVAGCAPGVGAGGIFLTDGDVSRPGCAASYPPVHALHRDEDVDAFVQAIACVVAAVRGGCGVEQPLEAALVALSPRTDGGAVPLGYVPPEFAAGLSPQGDDANAGFLRPASALGIIIVTDEDDASLAVPRLDDGGASLDVASGDPVLGEAGLGRALQPIERYLDGFMALRRNPALLVVATVAGVPSDLAPPPGIGSGELVAAYDRLLADPRLTESFEPTMVDARRLVPACTAVDGGEAFPARRLIEVMRGLELRGAGTSVVSICGNDFRPLLNRFVGLPVGRLFGACLPRPLAVDSDGRPDCVVEELLPAAEPGVALTHCSDLVGAATRVGAVIDGLGRERELCELRRLGRSELSWTSGVAGWFYDTSTGAMALCGRTDPPGQRISFWNHEPVEGAELRVRCRSPIPAYDEDGGAPVAACDP